MCTVSMITDSSRERWTSPSGLAGGGGGVYLPAITNEIAELKIKMAHNEQLLEDIKKEFLLMKELLKKAKIYDEENDEPNCEMDDKVEFMRKMATMLGVTIDDVFPR